MITKAQQVLTEIIDHFADGEKGPGDWWAPSEDHTSFALDWSDPDGRKFWLDLDKNGEISILWKRQDGTIAQITFAAVSSG